MYVELKKYKTNKKIEGIGILPDNSKIIIYYDELKIPLGDLLVDIFKLKKKRKYEFLRNKYRRKYNQKLWNKYVEILNTIKLQSEM